MQSFRYSLPSTQVPPPRPSRRRGPRIVAVLLAVGVLAGLGWAAPRAAQEGAATLGWVLGHPAVADERLRKADQLVVEGDQSLSATEYEGAQRRFGEALRLNPSLLQAWDRARLARYLRGDRTPPTAAALVPDPSARLPLLLALAERERLAGRLRGTAHLLDEAIALAPADARVHGALGALREAEGDLKAASEAYARACQIAPDDMDLVTARFEVRVRLGELDAACQEAIGAFQPHAARDTAPTARIGLVVAYLHTGLRPAEIRMRLTKDAPQLSAIERQLVLAEAHLRHYRSNPNWHRESFARVLEASGEVRRPEAGASASERITAVRLQLDAHAVRAQRFLDRSDVEAARTEVERALALAGEAHADARRFADLHAERARLLTLGNKAEAATQALEAAVRLVPTHPCRAELAKVQAGLGMTLLSAGRTGPAIGHLRRAVTLSPDDDGLLARFYQAINGPDRMAAVAACAEAIGVVDPGRVMAHLAHGFSQAHKPADAAKILQLAEAQHVDAARLAEIRAEAARAQGQRTRARDALLAALERRPTAELWYRLGAVEGELAQARAGGALARPTQRNARVEAHLAAALEAYRHAAAGDPVGPGPTQALETTRLIAERALALGDAALAERRAGEARVLAPFDPGLALLQAEALVRLKRPEPAQQVCLAGLAGVVQPGDRRHAALRLLHGQVLRQLKRPAEAIEALKTGLSEEAAAPPSRCADLWYELAFAHADAGQREEALNAVRQYVFWSMHDDQQKQRVPAIQRLEVALVRP